MTVSLWTCDLPEAAATIRFGEELALFLGPGDLVALSGDLGAGKSTLARAVIRSFVGDPALEVPSPTYTLVQGYSGPRGDITHVDLYRLNADEELAELGIGDVLAAGPVLVEWPERLDADLVNQALKLEISDSGSGGRRTLDVHGGGNWPERIERLRAVRKFIGDSRWAGATREFLPVDASARRYERLRDDGRTAILMDMPRLPSAGDDAHYRDTVHLARDVAPFVSISAALRGLGLSAPEICHADTAQSLALIEDFGDGVFNAMIAAGHDMGEPYRAAVDVLIRLARAGDRVAADDKTPIAVFDTAAMAGELDLLLQWYWPLAFEGRLKREARQGFERAWAPLLADLAVAPRVLMLRDFHSPNLMWLPDRAGIARVGLLDFQDAVMAHPAYDLVSLLQDARIDLPETLERDMLEYYFARYKEQVGALDEAAFRLAYATLGAQRNTKILGIFARLAIRDGKRRYLAHIDRVVGYLRGNLAHPGLSDLRGWYEAQQVLEPTIPLRDQIS